MLATYSPKKAAKQKGLLGQFENCTISGTATIHCKNKVLSCDYIGDSILFYNVNVNDRAIQHIWVHADEIVNLDKMVIGERYRFRGTVYKYVRERNNKPHTLKYSFRNVELLEEKPTCAECMVH